MAHYGMPGPALGFRHMPPQEIFMAGPYREFCCLHGKERSLGQLIELGPGLRGLRCRPGDECKGKASEFAAADASNQMVECVLHGKKSFDVNSASLRANFVQDQPWPCSGKTIDGSARWGMSAWARCKIQRRNLCAFFTKKLAHWMPSSPARCLILLYARQVIAVRAGTLANPAFHTPDRKAAQHLRYAALIIRSEACGIWTPITLFLAPSYASPATNAYPEQHPNNILVLVLEVCAAF